MASVDLDAAGLAGRIEELLESITADGGPAVGHAADELVRVLMRFYGAGLEQAVAIARAGGGDTLVHRMAADPLLGSLLALHDLHPVRLAQRADHAVERARRRLGAHGSGVRLRSVDPDGTVHVEVTGAGCGAATVQDVVTTALGELAPEAAGIVFDTAPALLQIGVRPPAQVPG